MIGRLLFRFLRNSHKNYQPFFRHWPKWSRRCASSRPSSSVWCCAARRHVARAGSQVRWCRHWCTPMSASTSKPNKRRPPPRWWATRPSDSSNRGWCPAKRLSDPANILFSSLLVFVPFLLSYVFQIRINFFPYFLPHQSEFHIYIRRMSLFHVLLLSFGPCMLCIYALLLPFLFSFLPSPLVLSF